MTRHVELDRVRLVYLHALVQSDPDTLAPTWGADAYIGFDTNAGWLEGAAGKFVSHPVFSVRFDSEWPSKGEGPPPEPDPENPPEVDIEAMFELTYSLQETDGISERDLEHFAFLNATFNAWPYWRELVQSLTVKAGLPPLVVPVFRVPDLTSPQSEGSSGGSDHPDPRASTYLPATGKKQKAPHWAIPIRHGDHRTFILRSGMDAEEARRKAEHAIRLMSRGTRPADVPGVFPLGRGLDSYEIRPPRRLTEAGNVLRKDIPEALIQEILSE